MATPRSASFSNKPTKDLFGITSQNTISIRVRNVARLVANFLFVVLFVCMDASERSYR